MSLVSVLLTYVLTVTTFLILPGPVNFFVINTTLKQGLKGTLLAIFGTNIASLLLIAIAGFLIVGTNAINSLILDFLTLLGGLFLLYYGAAQLYDLRQRKVTAANQQASIQSLSSNDPQQRNYSPLKLILQAFVIGISNPKDVIFFIAFFPPFILQMEMPISYSILILTLIWCVLDYALLFFYGALTHRFIKGRLEIILSFICGILFCALGFYALYLALTALIYS